jgi:hypothetical protein
MTPVELVPADALRGVDVGVSVSDSADLARLGLTPAHCEQAVAEIARAVLLAGGALTYGGRLRPEGFTQILMEEVQRYGDGRHALTICLAETEHRKLSTQELVEIDNRLGTAARLVLLDRDGTPLNIRTRPAPQPAADPQTDSRTALTALRRHITGRTHARIVVGGRLSGYQGSMPGILEEAIFSVAAGQPLYVAGGFGGAAASIARALDRDDQSWAPPGFPTGADSDPVRQALQQLRQTQQEHPAPDDGLTDIERRQLAASSRPGEIATLVVTGLARAHSPS